MFVRECVEIFNVNIEHALAFTREINEGKMDQARLLAHVQRVPFDTRVPKIPIHVPGSMRQTMLTPLQFHLLVWGLYIGYLRGDKPPEMQIGIQRMMFIRIVVDVDYKGDDLLVDTESAVSEVISLLKSVITCETNDFVVTKRDMQSKNFHIVSKSQVDIVSYWAIVDTLSNATLPSGYIIDRPTCWTVPTGRQHAIINKWESMLWDDVKRISAIDVWNGDLNTMLVLDNNADDSLGALVDESGGVVSRLKFGKWSKFENIFFQYNTHSLLSDKLVHSLQLMRDYLPRVLLTKPKTVEDEGEGTGSLEFFECAYTSTIEYLNPPADFITDCEKERAVVDFESIAASMLQMDEVEARTMNKLDEHREFLKTQKFQTTSSVADNISKIAKQCSREFQWESYIYRILKYIDDYEYIRVVVKAYFKYCERKGREPVVDLSFWESTDGSIEEDVYYGMPATVEVIKDVLRLMLNNCCVASVLSLLIRSNLFNSSHALVSAVLLVHSLGIRTGAKMMALEYISNGCADHVNAIGVKMQQSYFGNDMLYFLSEIYNLTIHNALIAFRALQLFPTSATAPEEAEEEAQPPQKKKRKANKKEKSSVEQRIFATYIAFMFQLGSSYYVFRENAFGRMTPADEVDTVHAAKRTAIEPSHDMYWYRREVGIYFSISGHFEFNAPSLYSPINILTYSPLSTYGCSIFRNDEDEIKSLLLDTFLKARHFIEFCGYNQVAFTLLSPLVPTPVPTTPYETVQIILVDLNAKTPFPDFKSRIHEFGTLHRIMSHLYAVVCAISTHCKVDIDNPASFIELCGADCVSNDDVAVVKNTEVFASDHVGGAFTEDETTFIRLLRLTVDNSESKVTAATSSDDDAVKLEAAHITTETTDSIKIYVATRFFDGVFLGKLADFASMQDSTVNFILLLLSWFVRFDTPHVLSPTNFFIAVDANRRSIYDELYGLVELFIGRPMVHRDMKNLKKHFKAFCQNTAVTIDEKFIALLPPGYTLGITHSTHKYADDIYYGMVGLIIFGQFVFDNTLDIYRFLVRFTHRGNVDRFMFALLNRTGTGKNFMIEYILDLLFPTLYLQKFSNVHFQSAEKEAGNILTDSMNANLVVWFDEVEKLQPSCKSFVGFGVLSEREFHQKLYINKRINSHVIISANSDPVGKDSATNNRMRPIDRKMQYVELIDNVNIPRTDGVVDTTLSKINEYLGVQLLLSRLPIGGETRVDDLGLYLVIWNSVQLFFHTFPSPVSRKTSKTMQLRMEKYLYTAEPALYLLKNNLIRCTPSQSMSLLDFENRIVALFGQYKNIIGGSFVVSDAVLDLKDRLSNYIRENRIYVDI